MKIFFVYDRIKKGIPIRNTETDYECACPRFLDMVDIKIYTISFDQLPKMIKKGGLFVYPIDFSSIDFKNINQTMSKNTLSLLRKYKIPIFGIDYLDVNFVHNIGNLIPDENPFPDIDFYLITSNLRLDKSRFRFFKKIYTVDYWESAVRQQFASGLRHWPPKLSINQIDFSEKNKDFLCLNRNLRPHRLALLSEFDRLNLFENTNFSAMLNPEPPGSEASREYKVNRAKYIIGKEGEQHFETFFKNLKLKSADTENSKLAGPFYAELSTYAETFFSIVTETEIRPDILFISEKPFKSIYFFHPFIIFGSPGILDWLRTQGYQTFPELFDESYDIEEHPQKKLSMIVSEVRKFKSLSLDEKRNKVISVIPKLQINHELFRDRPNIFKSQIENIFKELYNWRCVPGSNR